MQPLSGNQRPDLLTSLMNMSSCTVPATRTCIFADPLQMSHACHRFWKCYKTLTFCSLLRKCTIPCACHAKRHLNVQKWREHVVLLYMLTSKCALRHSRVHFFDISTSKSGPNMVCFCTFWLRNVLRATTACTFSTSQLPKVVRTWCVLYILTWKCASRHNGVHFFDISTSKSAPNWCVLYVLTWKCASRHNGVHFFDISTSKSGPNLVCFVHFDFEMCFAPQRRAIFISHLATTAEIFSLIWPDGAAPAPLASLLFDPPETQIIGKTQCFATFLPFRASASSFFWLFLFSDLLSSTLLFSLPLLHLCFSSVHVVGSLTSKLPSISSCNVLQLNWSIVVWCRS